MHNGQGTFRRKQFRQPRLITKVHLIERYVSREIGPLARSQTVKSYDLVSGPSQPLHDVAADKAGSPRDEYLHAMLLFLILYSFSSKPTGGASVKSVRPQKTSIRSSRGKEKLNRTCRVHPKLSCITPTCPIRSSVLHSSATGNAATARPDPHTAIRRLGAPLGARSGSALNFN